MVQAPGFTQSYNRYSYCWNNPLKYADPGGNTLYIKDLPHAPANIDWGDSFAPGGVGGGLSWGLMPGQMDRLVATRDGVQAAASRWLVTKYDTLNRPVLTALKQLSDSRSTLQGYFDSYSSHPYCETRTTTGVGYTLGSSFNSKFNLSESDLLTVTYYDTYDYPGIKSFDTSVNISCYSDGAGDSHYFDVVKGKVTGSRVKVLDGNENNSNFRWLISTNYYDDRYRVIEILRDPMAPSDIY